jgi:hypothetical protein
MVPKTSLKRKIARYRRRLFPLGPVATSTPKGKPTIKRRIARCRRVLVHADSAEPAKSGGKPKIKRRIARCRRILFSPPMNDSDRANPVLEASMWRVISAPHPRLSDLITRFHIDSPKSESRIASGGALVIGGWAIAVPEQQNRVHLVLRFPGYTLSHPLNTDRGDVIEKVVKASAHGHPQLKCGFRYSVPLAEAKAGFEIGFETDGYIYTVARVFAV